MEIAGDRPPRYGNIETRRSLLPQEGSPTERIKMRVFHKSFSPVGETSGLDASRMRETVVRDRASPNRSRSLGRYARTSDDLALQRGDNARGGLSPALRANRDREVSPTRRKSRPGGLSYGDILRIETGRARQRIYETPSFYVESNPLTIRENSYAKYQKHKA